MKRNSTARKALAATSVFLGVILASTSVVSGAQAESCSTNYPSRYMGGEADIIKAPNGALIYDKALEAVGQIVYTEPTVENLGDGIWVIGGYSIANFFVIEAPEGLIVYDTGIKAYIYLYPLVTRDVTRRWVRTNIEAGQEARLGAREHILRQTRLSRR